jgi:hypothetical protein
VSHNPAPCPICKEAGGYHVGHQAEVPTAWRYLFTLVPVTGRWTGVVYEDERGLQHTWWVL